MSTAFVADAEIERLIAGWQRDMRSVRRLADKTLEAYGRDLGQFFAFLGPHHGGQVSIAMLRDMRAADIRAFMAVRRQDGVEARSLARGLSAIKSFFRFLEREGVMATEALNIVRTPKAKKALPKALTVGEAKATIDATDELEDRPWVAARDMAVISLCYGAGLRISEALALSRIDLEGPTLRIVHGEDLPTLQFEVKNHGAVVPAIFRVDSGELGRIDDDGLFTPSGTRGGETLIEARVGSRILQITSGPREVEIPIEPGSTVDLPEAIAVRPQAEE